MVPPAIARRIGSWQPGYDAVAHPRERDRDYRGAALPTASKTFRINSATGSQGLLTATTGHQEMAFFELRQYKIRPGQMEAWLDYMQDEIIPFQVSKGMVICGSFRGEEDDSVYVWIRRFESEADRERLYKAVYESDHWKNTVSPRVGELIDRDAIQVQRITATRMSILH